MPEPIVQDPSQVKPPEGGEPVAQGAETVEQEIARLKRENEDHKRKISDLSTTNQTLEKRIEDVGKFSQKEIEQDEERSLRNEVASIQEESQIDARMAGEKLASLILRLQKESHKKIVQEAQNEIQKAKETSRQEAAFNQEFNAHIDSIRKTKPKLVPFEKRIARDAAILMQNGKPWKEAIDTAVSDFEKDFQPLIDRGAETPPEAPKGSQGEGSGDTQAPKEKGRQEPNRFEEAQDESPEAYVAMRKAAYGKLRGA